MHLVRRYRYTMFSSRESRTVNDAKAVLELYDTNRIAIIYFLADDIQLPNAAGSQANNIIMYYHLRDLPVIIDMLRNEKPVTLIDTPVESARLMTDIEIAGEGEIGG